MEICSKPYWSSQYVCKKKTEKVEKRSFLSFFLLQNTYFCCRKSSVNTKELSPPFDKIRRGKSVYLVHNRREAGFDLRVLSGYLFSGKSGSELRRITNDNYAGEKALFQNTVHAYLCRWEHSHVPDDDPGCIQSAVAGSHLVHGCRDGNGRSCIYVQRLEKIDV